MSTKALSSRSVVGRLMMLASAGWTGGMAIAAASGPFAVAAHASQPGGVLQPKAAEPSCEEKRVLLKLKAARAGQPARLESVPNPRWNPGSSREHQWVYREVPATPGKVGGKTSNEIDQMSCDEIDALYSSASGEGTLSNGYAMTPDGRVGGREERAPVATPLDLPSLVAPGARPDLKTGEWPTNTPVPLSKEELIKIIGDPEQFPATASEREKALAAAQAAIDSGATTVGALEAAMMAAYGPKGEPTKLATPSGDIQAAGINIPLPKGNGRVRTGIGKTETGEFAGVLGVEGSAGVKAKEEWWDFDLSDGSAGLGGLGIWWERDLLVPGIRGSGSFSTPIGEAGVECHSETGCEVYSEGSISNSFAVNGDIDYVFVPHLGPPAGAPPRFTSPKHRGPREGLKYFYDRAKPNAAGTATSGERTGSSPGNAGTHWFSSPGRQRATQDSVPSSPPQRDQR